jgi:hypothetical protein
LKELVDRVAREVGIEPATADNAVRIVLNFLHTDGPRETVERLAAEMGAGEALATPAKARGGLMGALASAMPGGGAMAAFSALTGAGLDMEQIEGLVKSIVAIAREKVGDETVEEVVRAVPGLERLLEA